MKPAGMIGLLTMLGVVVASAETKPNIVLIMADDLGYETIGANGGQSYKTPNLDQLAAGGIRFENCFVQPLCTPTRVELMTGRYNVRNYVNFGTLPRTETTFGNLLKKTGYATAICGKWQLGRETDAPQHFGFDESCLWQHTRRPPRYANPGLEYNGVEKDFTNGEYGPDLVQTFALEFIAKNKARPFFLYYPMMLTHDPYQPTPDSKEWDPKTTGEQAMQNKKHFADMVEYMDKQVGQLVAKLDELKLRDNTLVIFLGDNGTGRGVTSLYKNADYDGGKGSTTARGMHVPFIASWPAAMKKPAVNSDLIGPSDFLPTICTAAGAEIPENVDGVSFLPQLKGEKGTPRDWLYSWYSPRQNENLTVREAAFDAGHKLYRNGNFFDLRADPGETKPLVVAKLEGESAAAAKKLQSALDRFTTARDPKLDEAAKPMDFGSREKMKKKQQK